MHKSQSTKTAHNPNPKRQISRDKKDNMSNSVQSEVPPPQSSHGKGENVRVGIRIRPMNEAEVQRGDTNCLRVEGDRTLQINHKGVHKSYDFNYLLDGRRSQADCYKLCNVSELLEAAIEGYSATVFAYGQTGSGKTYSMAGKEELFTREVYRSDDREGIIPRAIQDLWSKIGEHRKNFSIKASYTEIYNEQIKDLLNPSSGVLHCRWNPANGFFVEDLIVVDCSDVDDMISVLNEGMKNRRSGSHEMNKDSSRSHSIMTLYIVSETKVSGNQSGKKYGKIAFVDLAGSERLKESKSQGEMIKETGNINKSLFTLGKVIKGLTDKKSRTPYIPYRDSKLTMLLMDSLGGNSKALMIACASPSEHYFDETLSTLNYAARTMNIRNKPVIQMDQKDQMIKEVQQEIDELRRENVYLREQYGRVNKGLPLQIPELASSSNNHLMKTALKLESSPSSQLPPLDRAPTHNPSPGMTHRRPGNNDTDSMISDYQLKFERVKKENENMRVQKDQSEEMYRKLMDTNGSIQNKLDNLEQIFLNKKHSEGSKDQIVTSGLLTQNTELKKRLREIEKDKIDLELQGVKVVSEGIVDIQLENNFLQEQIQKLQKRERQLLAELQKKK